MKYPILYKSNETDFFTMGLGPIEMLKATVTQERNGIFIFEGEILTDNPLFPLVLENYIIKADADHLLKDQRFRIKRIVPNHDGKAQIYAEHVSYLSRELTIKPEVNITGSAQTALNQWKASIVESNPFVVSSDITTSASTKWRIDKVSNPMMALGGVEGSILDRWGGEYLFDNYRISLLKKRGKTATNILAYGRNITDFEQERNILSTYTSVAPYAIYTDDNEKEIVVTVDGYVVDSEHINKYPNSVTKPIDFSSEFGSDEIPTKARLTTLAQQYIADNEIGVPTTSIKISFLDLSQTADYADYAFLEQVNLCDDVRVHYPKLGVNTIAKVVRVVWNCLAESYDEIEIGQKRMSLASQIQEQNKVIQEINTQVNQSQVSADGKNMIFYGLYGENGLGEPNATKIGDSWFKPNGLETELYVWTGIEWKLIMSTSSFGEIEDTIKTLDDELEQTTTTANDAVNKAEQAIRDAGFANSAIEAADGKISSLEQNLEGFQQVVQNTYADKTTVTALANQWTQTTELANGHTGQISNLGEQINLRLTKAQVAEEILNDKTAIRGRETTNDAPQYYYDNYRLQKVREYKNATALGLIGNYSGLLETESQGASSPWPTFKQTFYTTTYTHSRSAIDGGTWGSWSRMVDSSNVLSQINLSEEGVLIQGKNIWLDGNTKIDNAVIKTAHIADLAVNGAKIADATIGSAKIINLDASKITANTLSAITTNTGALNVSGDLTMTTDNTLIKGTFNYGDPYNGAHNPRYFANGSMMVGRQNIQYEANVHAVNPDNSMGAWKYFGNAYFGPDTVKLRNLRSPNGVVNATTSIYGGEIVVASDYEGIDNGVTISSAGGGRITALGGATIGAGIDPSIYSSSFQINGSYRNNIAKMHLSNGPQGASFNWANNQGFADLFIGRDSSPVIWSNNVYSRTYSQASNMVINTDGSFGRTSSASRYKLNISEIENLDQLAYNLLTIEPKRWNDKRETEAIAHEMSTGEDKVRDSLHLRQYHGLIAEDLRAAGLDPYISYNNKTGAIDGIEYDKLWTLLLPIIKKHQEDILELQLKMGVA